MLRMRSYLTRWRLKRCAATILPLRGFMREVDVFGRRLLVERTATGWRASVPGADGKRGPVSETLIPALSAPTKNCFSISLIFGTRMRARIGKWFAGFAKRPNL